MNSAVLWRNGCDGRRFSVTKSPMPRALWLYPAIAALFGAALIFSLLVAARSVQSDYSQRLTQATGAATIAAAGRAALNMAGIKAALDLLVAQIAETELRFKDVANGLSRPLALTMRHPSVLGAEIREAGGEVIARLGATAGAFPPPSLLFAAEIADDTIIHRPRPLADTISVFALQRVIDDRAGRRVSVTLLVNVNALAQALPADYPGDIRGMLVASTTGDILAAGGGPFANLKVGSGAVFAALPQSYRPLLPGEVRGYRARVDAAGPERIFAYAAVAGWPMIVIAASLPPIGWGMVDLILSRGLAIGAPVIATLLLFLTFFSARWAGHRRQLAQLDKSLRRTRAALRGVEAGLIVWEHGADTVDISASWKRMLGYDRDEIGDQLEDWLNRIHHEDRPQAMRGLQAVIDGTLQTHRQTIRMVSKRGISHTMMQTISAVRGNPADPPTMVLTQIAMATAAATPQRTPALSQAQPRAAAHKVA